MVFVGEAFAGETVGLKACNEGLWHVQLGSLRLGILHERSRTIVPMAGGVTHVPGQKCHPCSRLHTLGIGGEVRRRPGRIGDAMGRADHCGTRAFASPVGESSRIDPPLFDRAEPPGQHRPSGRAAFGVAQHRQEHRLHRILGGGGIAPEVHRDQQQARRRRVEHGGQRGGVALALEGAEVAVEFARVHDDGCGDHAAGVTEHRGPDDVEPTAVVPG